MLRRDADQLRVQASQDCVSGIDLRTHGMQMKANPILHQVEQLINDADQLEREAKEKRSQIEKTGEEIIILESRVLEHSNFRSKLVQCMFGFQTQSTDLQRRLQEKKRELEEKRKRVFQIRDEEDSYALAASYKEEEADEKIRQSDDAEREAQCISKFI